MVQGGYSKIVVEEGNTKECVEGEVTSLLHVSGQRAYIQFERPCQSTEVWISCYFSCYKEFIHLSHDTLLSRVECAVHCGTRDTSDRAACDLTSSTVKCSRLTTDNLTYQIGFSVQFNE